MHAVLRTGHPHTVHTKGKNYELKNNSVGKACQVGRFTPQPDRQKSVSDWAIRT